MKLPTAPMVCHVLLIETDNGLVLVDSGYGTDDCADPRRVGPTRRLLRAILSHAETAVHQIERLGYARDDVRHIVITHLDVDHAGGLSDFPAAQVHVTSAEALGAIRAPSRREKIRYRSAQWAHDPTIVEHDPHGREVAWVRRRQGTRRDLAGHRARIAARPHPRPRLRGRRCRPPLGAARRRRVLSLRHPRRDAGAAGADGDGVPRSRSIEKECWTIMLASPSSISVRIRTC